MWVMLSSHAGLAGRLLARQGSPCLRPALQTRIIWSTFALSSSPKSLCKVHLPKVFSHDEIPFSNKPLLIIYHSKAIFNGRISSLCTFNMVTFFFLFNFLTAFCDYFQISSTLLGLATSDVRNIVWFCF